MLEQVFSQLSTIDTLYWRYIGFFLIVLVGVYFSYRSNLYQFRVLSRLPATIKILAAYSKRKMPGVSPLQLYFVSIGGMAGLGNIVAIMTTILIGGPGALFWLWIAAFAGMIIKYAEIYLGLRYRRLNTSNGYDGGPMFIIPEAFKGKLGLILANLAAFLLCIYGIEILQFTIIIDSIHDSFNVPRELTIILFVLLIIYIGIGGVKRLAALCTMLMPIFIVLYVGMCLWVIILHIEQLPEFFITVFKSAFVGHAAIGGFSGSTILMAAQQGAARAVYSGDIAIGFDSIIQSETKAKNFHYQAQLAIVAALTDTFICTLSITIIYLSDLWTELTSYKLSEYATKALSMHIPYSKYLILTIIFLAGFTTIQAYFTVGLKAAKFISPRYGKLIYFLYAIFAFWFFAHYDQSKISAIMGLAAGLLILINISTIIRLRKEISFKLRSSNHSD